MAAVVLAAWTFGCSTDPSAATASDASFDGSGEAATSDASAVDAREGGAPPEDVVTATDVALDPTDDTTNFNDCTPFDFASNDHTAPGDPRVITFPVDPAPAQYQPRCMKKISPISRQARQMLEGQAACRIQRITHQRMPHIG